MKLLKNAAHKNNLITKIKMKKLILIMHAFTGYDTISASSDFKIFCDPETTKQSLFFIGKILVEALYESNTKKKLVLRIYFQIQQSHA